MSGARILIMAGGTGGHVFPALAVASYLRERGHQVSWLGTRRGMEAELVPAHGFEIDYIAIAGLRGNGLLGWLAAPLRISHALVQALGVMRRRRPQAVLGMGGFVTGPGGVAARLSGRPLLIHEQNAIAGLTNRLLSHIASRVLEAFPATFSASKVRHVGNPVRGDIAALAAPEERFAGRQGPLRLLVVGGSLGALALNELIPAALALLPVTDRPEVRHQCGRRHLEVTEAAYETAGVEGEVFPFIDDMAAQYGWADLVICRAGALTVSELALAGVASILIPFPYAVDDHQSANGGYLVKEGAAQLVQQRDLDSAALAEMVGGYCRDPVAGREKLVAMAQRARRLAMPGATAAVAAACLLLAGFEGEVEG
ncbi:MAG: undecaprenyldiphospho-muramoylpentapeptide beta-N-acetylglucosaminyltransferase [Gammaproteobacteria bacterium]|nr:undecaprenyldiphospho-muramoylpentapeptide beta-N-acetylglucosaminyltransferase [Gammaproteobacteria bacterium]